MGIENDVREHRRATSHYPSWGSKTGPASYVGAASSTSLPLMGIENTHVPLTAPVADECRSLPLMGIENALLAYGPLTTGHRSHYPSWGSKTAQPAPSAWPPAADSLPLMGIENRWKVPRIWPPSYDSLPLMGIENAAAPWRWRAPHRPRFYLITPHGDRKHAGHPEGRAPKRRLITPHGDRKPPAVRVFPLRVPVPVSLPLMGIENPASSTPADC